MHVQKDCLTKAFDASPSFFAQPCSVTGYCTYSSCQAQSGAETQKTSRGPKCIPLKHVHSAKLIQTYTIKCSFSLCTLTPYSDRQRAQSKCLQKKLKQAFAGNKYLIIFKAVCMRPTAIIRYNCNYIHSLISLRHTCYD